jgi:hypothetical protein
LFNEWRRCSQRRTSGWHSHELAPPNGSRSPTEAAHASATRLTAQLNELRQTFRALRTSTSSHSAPIRRRRTPLQVLDATRMPPTRLTYSRTPFAQRKPVPPGFAIGSSRSTPSRRPRVEHGIGVGRRAGDSAKMTRMLLVVPGLMMIGAAAARRL